MKKILSQFSNNIFIITLLVDLLLSAISMILVDTIIDSILIESFKSALGAAAVLSIIIICIKPFIKKIENSLHVILFSMLMFILNGLIVLIMAYIIPGFEVYGGIFISAWYAILVGIVKNIIIRIIDIF